MTIIGVTTALVLAVISLLHALWGAGIWWPVREETALARTVTGFRGTEKMPPPAASLAVALATGLLAVLAFIFSRLVDVLLPDQLLAAAGFVSATVFILRGMVGFTRRWALLTPEQPFRRLDRNWYSPLCLALGLSFASLAWSFMS